MNYNSNYEGSNNRVNNRIVSGPISNFFRAVAALSGVFIAFIILLFMSFFLFNSYKLRNYQPIEGIVVKNNIDEFDNVLVSYKVNNVDYNSELFIADDYIVGDKVTFYYDINDPNNIVESKTNFNSLILPYFIFLFVFIGFVVIFRRRLNNYLHFLNPEKFKYDYSLEENDND